MVENLKNIVARNEKMKKKFTKIKIKNLPSAWFLKSKVPYKNK